MATNDNGTAGRERPLNFLEEIIEDHINSVDGRIHTRFPPEPNGYLHIGHAKSICLNFGLAERYGGLCNLRFDDTNPVKEDVEYVDSIKEDIRWLGFRWAEEHYASDYFEQLYAWAVQLIKQGLAYVDDQSQEEIRQRPSRKTGTNLMFYHITWDLLPELLHKLRPLRSRTDQTHIAHQHVEELW